MAYERSNLVSRAGYSGVGGFWDSLTSAAGSALSVVTTTEQAQGAAAQANRDLTAAMVAQQGGIGTGTILLLGGVGVAAFLLLRKKKPAATP